MKSFTQRIIFNQRKADKKRSMPFFSGKKVAVQNGSKALYPTVMICNLKENPEPTALRLAGIKERHLVGRSEAQPV